MFLGDDMRIHLGASFEDTSLINTDEILVQTHCRPNAGISGTAAVKSICDELLDIGDDDSIWAYNDPEGRIGVIFPIRLLKNSIARENMRTIYLLDKTAVFDTVNIVPFRGVTNVRMAPKSMFYIPR